MENGLWKKVMISCYNVHNLSLNNDQFFCLTEMSEKMCL